MPNRSLYLGIALATALLAGLGGYFWATYRAGLPVDPTEADALVEMGHSTLEDLQLKLESDIAARPRSAAEERLASPLGQALFRKCSEWMDFYENQPGEEARAYRDEACREHRDYVDNGTLPPTPPNAT